MAYSKIILNGETLMDVTSDTVDAGNLLSGKTATKNSGAKVTGNIATKSSSDLTASGATVTAPAGYYSASASKAVATTTHPNPTAAIASSTGVVTATHTQGTGYVTGGTTTGTLNLTTQAATTYNTSTADQTVPSYRWLTGTQTIKSVTTSNLTAANIASGVVVKVGDANNASRITQVTGTYAPAVSSLTVTPTETSQTFNATGVYGYKPVTVNAISSTYVGSGVPLKSDADVYLVSENARVVVPRGYYNNPVYFNMEAVYGKTITPTESIQTAVSSGYFTRGDIYVGAISSTYVGTGIAKKSSADTTFTSTTGTFTAPVGYYSAAATKTITTQAAQTIYPSTADQTIASYRWLTGTQTIKSVITSNLTAANIAEGVVVKVGDANNASRIAQITGTFIGSGSGRYKCYITAGSTNSAYDWVKISGTNYRSTGSTFDFDENTTIQVGAGGNYSHGAIYLDGVLVADSGQNESVTYSFTPNCSFDIEWDTSSGHKCYITTYKLPQGTLNITTNGTYDVQNYASASVSVAGSPAWYSLFATSARSSTFFPGNMSFISSMAMIPTYLFAGMILASGPWVFSQASLISDYAFLSCFRVEYTGYSIDIEFPSCTRIGKGAFTDGRVISTVNFPECTSIDFGAFQNCFKLYDISFPKCNIVGAQAFYNCSSLASVNFPVCTKISGSAFYVCKALTTVNFPQCSRVSPDAFYSCTTLQNISFPVCQSIDVSAFCGTKISSLNLPECISISNSAFNNCQSLITVSIPKCTSIGSTAFYFCHSLTTIYCPSCTNIGYGAFSQCSSLKSINLPECIYISANAFCSCVSLSLVNIPKCTSIGAYAFQSCVLISTIDLPQCVSVGGYAFSDCSSLSIVSLPQCSNFGSYTFNKCVRLISLYLNNVSTVPTFGYRMFNSTPISTYSTVAGRYGSIFVPSSLYTSFITATDWSLYSARIVSV